MSQNLPRWLVSVMRMKRDRWHTPEQMGMVRAAWKMLHLSWNLGEQDSGKRTTLGDQLAIPSGLQNHKKKGVPGEDGEAGLWGSACSANLTVRGRHSARSHSICTFIQMSKPPKSGPLFSAKRVPPG